MFILATTFTCVLFASTLEIQEPTTPQADASRKIKEAEVRSQLLERVKADQDFRRRIIELSIKQREKPSDEITKQMKELHEKGMHIDKENTTWMKDHREIWLARKQPCG